MNLSSRRTISIFFVITVVVCVFSPSLSSGYLNYDDPTLILENPDVLEPGFARAGKLFFVSNKDFYMPLFYLSFMTQQALVGLGALSTHGINLSLHLISAVIFYALSRRLGFGNFLACAGALYFAISPLRVESVVWASGRKDLLYALFLLASLYSYVRFRDKGIGRDYFVSLIAFILSLWSKPAAVALPALLIAYDMIFYKTAPWKSRAALMPFLALFILFFGLTRTIQVVTIPSLHDLIGNQATLDALYQAPLFYIRQMLLPYPVTMFHRYPLSASQAFENLVVCTPFLLVIGGNLVRKGDKLNIFFALLFLAIALAPAAEVARTRFVLAERYTYVPAMGMSILLMCLIRGSSRPNNISLVSSIVLAGILVAGFQTYRYCEKWRENTALWTDVIEKDDLSQKAYYLRGISFMEAYRFDEAEKDFQMALALSGSDMHRMVYDFECLHFLANIRANQKRMDAALAAYRKTLNILSIRMAACRAYFASHPNLRHIIYGDYLRMNLCKASTLFNLGRFHQRLGHRKDALRLFKQALLVHPEYNPALLQSASIYYSEKEYMLAERLAIRCMDLNPRDLGAKLLLGRIRGQSEKKI